MNVFLTILFIMTVHFSVIAQIPNGGFENWQKFQNYEIPYYWKTNQSSEYERFEKDSLSVVKGSYSLKIVASSLSAWQDCRSNAWNNISLDEPIGKDKNLTFYVKSIPDSLNETGKVYLWIRGNLYKDGEFISKYEWKTSERIDAFTKIQIPIEYPDIDSFTVIIFGGAENGADDGCYNSSTSWIDGMEITKKEITSAYEQNSHKDELKIYPNPSNGSIEIEQSSDVFTQFHLYTLDGMLIESGDLHGTTITLKNNQRGIFLLMLTDDNETVKTTRRLILK